MLAWAVRYVLFDSALRSLRFSLLIALPAQWFAYDFFFDGTDLHRFQAGMQSRALRIGRSPWQHTAWECGRIFFPVAGLLTDLYALRESRLGRIWLNTAAFAVVILALFAELFRNETLRGRSA